MQVFQLFGFKSTKEDNSRRQSQICRFHALVKSVAVVPTLHQTLNQTIYEHHVILAFPFILYIIINFHEIKTTSVVQAMASYKRVRHFFCVAHPSFIHSYTHKKRHFTFATFPTKRLGYSKKNLQLNIIGTWMCVSFFRWTCYT